jgi:hypothetical protein
VEWRSGLCTVSDAVLSNGLAISEVAEIEKKRKKRKKKKTIIIIQTQT